MARANYGMWILFSGLRLLALASVFSGTGGVVFADDLAAKSKGPAVGDVLPELEALEEQGNAWKSAGRAGKGPLVIYFYPGDFTGGCIKQAQ